jgi:hypothetical protein
VIDKLEDLRKKYSDFVINSEKNYLWWKEIGTAKAQLQFNVHLGSADNKDLQPICEDYGLGCYSVLVANGISGP